MNLRHCSRSSWEWVSGGWGEGFHGNQPYSKWKNEQGVEGERNGEEEKKRVRNLIGKIRTGGL